MFDQKIYDPAFVEEIIAHNEKQGKRIKELEDNFNKMRSLATDLYTTMLEMEVRINDRI